MKTTLLAFTLVALTVLSVPAQTVARESSSKPTPVLSTANKSEPASTVIEIGENHRVWQRVVTETNEFGKVVSTTNAFTELQTGLYYKNGPGDQWLETKAEIELLADGAAATNGPHKVFFAANLNAPGAISLTTPEGRLLRSRVFGLSVYDAATGKAVLIAETKDSIGQLIYPNQVIYTNAFDDVSADVQYFYTKAGLEQNIVVRAQLPDPAEFGLSRESSILQVLTEFYDAPAAERKPLGSQATGLQDEVVDFGRMKMARGKAFSVGDETARAKSVPVAKQWVVLSGRTFLVEEVPFKLVDAQLQTLTKPKRTAALKPRLQGKGESITAALLSMLPQRTASHTRGVVRLAKLDTQKQPGLVLDYSILNGATNFTFKGDTTYFVTNSVNLFGTTTIEGGTVLKFAANGAGVVANDEIVFKTSPYRMALFTSKDDNSVGETISGSTGSPAFGSSSYLTAWTAHYPYLRFCYAGYGLTHGAAGLAVVEHCQFVNCDQAFGSSADAALRNVLFAHCNLGVAVQNNATNTAEQVTADQCNLFFLDTEFGCSSPLQVTNSIFTAVTNLGCNVQLDHCVQATNTVGVFQTVGAGNYYLAAGSTNRGAGTTSINAGLLAALQNKTTYPPVVLSNVSISVSTNLAPQAQRGGVTPDLGYHYDPLDYLTCWFTVSNATLTVDSGTAIACYRDVGIWIADGSSIVSRGTPLTPNWFTRHSLVQEQPVAFGGGPGAVINSYHYADLGPTGVFRFSRFSCPAGANDYHLYHVDFSGAERFAFDNLSVRDCEFWNGMNYLSGARTNAGPVTLNNNLFYRSRLWANSTASQQSLALSNNLVVGMNLGFYGATSDLWKLYDNAFDTCTFILSSHPVTNGNNAYINCANRLNPTNAGDVVLTNFTYQPGPLGDYYQPANSVLINVGSTTNAGWVGFYHYTVTANQAKEAGSRLDIGLHYVAVGTDNLPLDGDADALPDYLDADSDGDGLQDNWEIKYFGSLSQTGAGDSDGDGLTNTQEQQLGTNPANIDTDGDGLTDSEELAIPVDVDKPELGFLDPTRRQTGNTGTDDGKKDSDHDGISNLGEVEKFLSDPADAHTFNATRNDAEYLTIAKMGESATLSLAVLSNPSFPGGGQVQFTITDAFAGAQYDLYFVNNIAAQRWQWRRVYSGIECDNAGEAMFKLPMPDPYQGYFVILAAEDYDGDGLTDGYESWFNYSGQRTFVDFDFSDSDLMRDGWEVEYGINPTVATGNDGDSGDPDADIYSNLDEYFSYYAFDGSFDPLKVYNTSANRPVVSIFNSTPNWSCDEATFTIYRYAGIAGSYSSALKVYYSVGGSLTYGTDYTLSPTPAELPRIYSVEIPAGQQQVTVAATLVGNSVPSDMKTLVATITPYSVSPVLQVSDPASWAYTVDWNYNRATAYFYFDYLRPNANGQDILVCQNTPKVITLTGYDGCGDSLTFIKVSNPSHGTLGTITPIDATSASVTYTPTTSYQGADSFTFKVNDGVRDSAVATVSITVGDQPVANSQIVQACRNTDEAFTLNTSTACGALTYIRLSNPTHGSLLGTEPNLTYRPNTGYEGSDSFTFKVNNGSYDSDIATVSIDVGYPPNADGQYRVTHLVRVMNVTLTGSDGCNDSLTFSIMNNPTLGILGGTAPNKTYTANAVGNDSFTFRAYDGVRYSGEATVSIAILPGVILTAVGACDSIGLEWTVPDEALPYVEDFVIYRSTSAGGTYSVIGTVGSVGRSFTDTTVTPGVTYYYKVSFHYTDPGDSTAYESFSNIASASTRSTPNVGATDIAFILDNTGSMGTDFLDNLRDKIGSILNCIEDYSGSDYRLALVTPDNDQVNVRVSFSANNRSAFEAALNSDIGAGGNGTPESTDECLNTILNARAASGRTNPRSGDCSPAGPLQLNNFTPAFRTNALKLVVLITDAEPGGFCDFGDNGAKAHQYALQARSNCIKINAIHVALDGNVWDVPTETVMRDYQRTSCGWYSQSPRDGGDVARYVLKMVYENGYCTCP